MYHPFPNPPSSSSSSLSSRAQAVITGGARKDLLITHGYKHKRYRYREGLQAIGGALARLTQIISVGYLQCAGPPSTDANPTFPSHIDCPFEGMLGKMLSSQSAGVLTKRDVASLETLTARGPIKRASMCKKNGELGLSAEERHAERQQRKRGKARRFINKAVTGSKKAPRQRMRRRQEKQGVLKSDKEGAPSPRE